MVKIDRFGDRSNIVLDLKKIDAGGHQLLGTWAASTGLLTVDGGHSGRRKSFVDPTEPLIITTVLVCILYSSHTHSYTYLTKRFLNGNST